ncbi:MAG: SDR family NAD(P)-dependent oxidoreductase, partial [Candidatus Eisenbacteria bacterium]|nr:SDR family NAD(P)-dependent oxidoreductase [Candidatus Eisenbacteria bacterium]
MPYGPAARTVLTRSLSESVAAPGWPVVRWPPGRANEIIRPMKLEGQAAIVTGGGRGIGRAISLRFAAEGAAVTVAGTGRAHLERTAAEIRNAGGRARVAIADVSDEAAVESMVAGTVGEFGRLDALVSNAGITGPTAPVVELERADWDRTLA